MAEFLTKVHQNIFTNYIKCAKWHKISTFWHLSFKYRWLQSRGDLSGQEKLGVQRDNATEGYVKKLYNPEESL
jgi:hypothetical protein